MKRLGKAKLQARPPLRFVTVVWGESHVSAMLELAWRTMLSENNVPALVAEFDVSYALYTSEADRERIVKSPQYARLASLVRIEIFSFSDKEMHENRYIWHWTVWRNAIDWAKNSKAVVFLVIPDVLYFDGTLARWGTHIRAGKRAIFTIGTWVSEETFIPEFMGRYPLAKHDSVAIAPEEGMDFMLRHLHPVIAATFRNSGHSMFHFDRMTDVVQGEGFVSRTYSSQPLVFDPAHFHLDNNKCPLNKFEDIAFEDVCILSTGPMLHVMEFYHGQPSFSEDALVGLTHWSFSNVGSSHSYEAKFGYHYIRGDVVPSEDAWASAERSLDKTGAGVIAVRAINMLWRFARAKDCHRAADLIAVAAWKHSLHRATAVDGAYTVFLPIDSAFASWSEDFAAGVYKGETDPHILILARNHIVRGRLYLRPGDCVALDGANESDPVRTLEGRKLSVRHELSGGVSGFARIVSCQSRAGFATVYLIDKLMTDTHSA